METLVLEKRDFGSPRLPVTLFELFGMEGGGSRPMNMYLLTRKAFCKFSYLAFLF